MNDYNYVCAERNIVDAKHHIICNLLQHHLCEAQPRSFVPKMNNDVLASLEMMLTFGQMMLFLSAQMKKSNSYELDFLAGAQGFEPRKCQSQSLMPYRLAMPQYFQQTIL